MRSPFRPTKIALSHGSGGVVKLAAYVLHASCLRASGGMRRSTDDRKNLSQLATAITLPESSRLVPIYRKEVALPS